MTIRVYLVNKGLVELMGNKGHLEIMARLEKQGQEEQLG